MKSYLDQNGLDKLKEPQASVWPQKTDTKMTTNTVLSRKSPPRRDTRPVCAENKRGIRHLWLQGTFCPLCYLVVMVGLPGTNLSKCVCFSVCALYIT